MTIRNLAKTFHDNLDTSWNTELPISEVYIVTGTNICTPGQLRTYFAIDIPLLGGGRFQRIPRTDLLHVNGDGTVPLFSSTLTDTARGLDYNYNAQVYYVSNVDHGKVPVDDKVLQLVANILLHDDATAPRGITRDQTGSCAGKVISVESPVELHVYDNVGNHTGLTELPNIPDSGPMVEQGIPGSTYDELLESKLIYLPQNGIYTVRLKATNEGSFNLRLRSYEDDQIVRTILFLRVPLTLTTVGQMTYDTTSDAPPILELDQDGDGTFEQTITAASDLDASDSEDTQPPVVQILSPDSHRPFAGGVRVVWQTTDDLSGVFKEWGFIDQDTPNALQVANGAVISLPPGLHTLTVLAEDRAGNASQEEATFTVYPVEWLAPLNTEPYTTKMGRIIPVKFQVHDLAGAV